MMVNRDVARSTGKVDGDETLAMGRERRNGDGFARLGSG